ncbi:MAG: ATP-binding cassette domain-containing protein [Clostridiaceae bacterium]|nr:ATP-binding cassette domain-containing protein [Clostridiaceae bacterium]
MMIEAKGVYLEYPEGTVALKDIELKIGPGELIYITGPSGSGKTSLLKLFMGAEYPTAGSLKVLGQLISRGQASGIRSLRRLIGPVFQDFRLIKGRSALENVMLGMRFLDIPPVSIKGNARNALEKVGLGQKMLSLVEHMSWGECQRVAIARAVAREPALIIADEPTGNLDKDNAVNILELLKSFKDAHRTIIITTHATHLIENEKDAGHIRMDNGSLNWERSGGA